MELNDPLVSAEFWTSYMKVGWTPDVQPLIPSSVIIAAGLVEDRRSKDILKKIRLFGNVFAKHDTSNASECFDKCDADVRCAAACSKKSECDLLKYGFEKVQSDAWTSYTKPEVSYEIANFDRLAGELSIKYSTRFTKAYEGSDTLTPSLCFRRCNESVDCAAASFTVDPKSQQNCFLYKKGVYGLSGEDKEFWVSFVKVVAMPSVNVVVAVDVPTVATTKAREPLIMDIQNSTVIN
jgi:hypothetical protein